MTDRAKAAKLRIGVLCINFDPDSRSALGSMVVQAPGAYLVDNVDRQIVPREVMRILESFQYRICVIDFDGGLEDSCRVAERLRDSCDSSVALFAASSDATPSNIIAAMRSGCTEYLTKPFDADQVLEALAHVEARRHIKDDGASGTIVTVLGAKGGTGATSLATNLALNLVERHQRKCLLIDQHPALGDVALYLGLKRSQYSFNELVHNTDRLDNELLEGFLLQHQSGLHVLGSPERLDSFPYISPEAIEHTLAFLSENYQFVIIDCPSGISESSGAAIRQSNRLAIVITPELPAIRNAVRWVEYLVDLHYPEGDIDIVLNRHAKDSALSDREIEEALRRPVSVKIPNSYSEMRRAINAGMPPTQRRNSSLPPAFDNWAHRLLGQDPVKLARSSKGFLGLFNS
jgi:pilus assembly protein CpaE